MLNSRDVAGSAALAIVESLLLSLFDRKILQENEILGILKDAASAHEHASPAPGDEQMHREVASLIANIISSGNSVRRT